MPDPTPDDLTALEQALRGLAPHPGGLDRDELLFCAGRASAPRRWFWPAATAAALLLAALLAWRPQPAPVERIVFVPVPVPAPPATVESPPEAAAAPAAAEEVPPHRRLHEHLLRWGLDGLGQPPPPPPAHPYLSTGELLP